MGMFAEITRTQELYNDCSGTYKGQSFVKLCTAMPQDHEELMKTADFTVPQKIERTPMLLAPAHGPRAHDHATARPCAAYPRFQASTRATHARPHDNTAASRHTHGRTAARPHRTALHARIHARTHAFTHARTPSHTHTRTHNHHALAWTRSTSRTTAE